MASSFRPFLVNDLFGDPALYVGLPWARRAILFDLGDLGALSAGRLLKISDVFVSHTHVDHFVGFDYLLRVLLGRPKALRLYGPPGFIEHVDGKLRGYAWNLVDGYSLSIEVDEVHPDRVRRARFACPRSFRREDAPDSEARGGLLRERTGVPSALRGTGSPDPLPRFRPGRADALERGQGAFGRTGVARGALAHGRQARDSQRIGTRRASSKS